MQSATIVVGVDGSECARDALRLAADEAQLRHAPLRIVCAWEVPLPVFIAGAPPVDQSVFDTFQQDAERVVQDARSEVQQWHPDLICEATVIEGNPAQVLVDESRDAGLTVVGNRGRGGFRSLLMRSVSQQVVHYSHCPVLVVRQYKSTEVTSHIDRNWARADQPAAEP